MHLMHAASQPPAGITFGRFGVLPHRRELLVDGQPVKLGGRAFDVLMALIETPGAVIDKDELMRRVWPGRVVEENNLQVQISTLRAAFGPQRQLIRTVAGRGYQFTGDIEGASATLPARATAAQPASALPATNLPELLFQLIGRDEELVQVMSLTGAHRLVTLTGTGGIGKTRLALEVSRRLADEFAQGVWFVELASLTDPDLVPGAVAAAAKLELAGGPASPERVADALSGTKLLVVLDNCEHVIESAAKMAEALLRANPRAHVIATSRELLRAEGEWVYQVPSLGVPPADAEDVDPLQYGSIRLFIERARAADPHFAADRQVAAAIAGICRQVDGIPLAIELVAAHCAMLGMTAIRANFDDRFGLLTGGRRTALPRHQTLRATLDWSFELLAESERAILRRLAVFAGGFTLEAASAIVASIEFPHSQVVNGLANLIAKSLVSTEGEAAVGRYRLLETTRAYALEKLSESGERERLLRSHAEYFRYLLERAEAEWKTRPTAEWLSNYASEIDNLRVALDWAMSPAGDATLGIALTIASEHLWFGLSLMDECRRRVESALFSLRANVSRDTRLEMQLCAAFGAALYYAKGPCPEACAAWTDVLAIAGRLDATEYRLRALWGLWSHHAGSGELRVALSVAQQLASLPPDQAGPDDLIVGERLLGSTLYFMGELSNARRHLEHVLSRYPASPAWADPDATRFEWSRRAAARGSLVPVLWLQGFPDQAMEMAQAYVDEAQATGHPVSVCWALYAACPVALAIGDLATAERYVAILLDHSARHAPGFLQALAHGLHGELLIKRGNAVGGVQCLRIALDELSASGFVLRRPALLGALAEGLAAAGSVAEGHLAIAEAVAQCERTDELWNITELLRIKCELLLLEGTPEAMAAAEDHFQQALDWGRRQGALSWQLRCATSLARLLKEQGRVDAARELLSATYNRFTEGFDTADLKGAKALLVSLSGRVN